LGIGASEAISLPILEIGQPFPIHRDTHQAQHFTVVRLLGSLAGHSGRPASEKFADSDISFLSIQPQYLTGGGLKSSTICQAANGFRRNNSATPTKPFSEAEKPA
jgi:hypothetical protein